MGRLLKRFLSFKKQMTEPLHVAEPPHYLCLRTPLHYSIEPWLFNPNIAVICHIYYVDLVEEILSYLKNIPFKFDLFITTDSKEKKATISILCSHWEKGLVTIEIVKNRGRDIAPKLITFAKVYSNYEFFLHIHSKKTPHMQKNEWRKYLFDHLLGSKEIVESIFEAFRQDKNLGMIAPQHIERIKCGLGWAYNFNIAQNIAHKFGVILSLSGPLDFPSGSMFWARSKSIMPLLNCHFQIEDFPIENGQNDGTLAHAIERLYFFSCEMAGYRWIKTGIHSGVIVNNQVELINYIISNQIVLIQESETSNKIIEKDS